MTHTKLITIGAAIMLAAGSAFAQSGPPAPNPNGTNSTEGGGVDLDAVQAARRTVFTNRFKAWVQQSEVLPGGQLATAAARAELRQSQLVTMGTEFKTQADADSGNAATFSTNTGIPLTMTNEFGEKVILVKMSGGVPLSLAPHNTLSADTIGADEIKPGGSLGLGLTGAGIKIGIIDGGDVRGSHVEFTNAVNRVSDIDGFQGLSSHATHVAGTMAGYGAWPAAQGFATNATVFAAFFDQDTAKMPGMASTNGLRISNHSYGFQCGWGSGLVVGGLYYPIWWGDVTVSTTEDFKFGFYSPETRQIDQVLYTAQNYLQVWSAANERGSAGAVPLQPNGHLAFSGGSLFFYTSSRPVDGNSGYDLLPPQVVAKNVLTVAAVEPISGGYTGSNTVVMTTFSSFGPADDGRVKPDISTDGLNLLSPVADSDNSYAYLSGTSMASPSAAGALALLSELQESYLTNHVWLSSTLKGLAIHTADEAGSDAGPDYRFGWGLMNAKTAATLVTNNYTPLTNSLPFIKEVRLVSGDYVEFPVTNSGAQPLKVTLCWTDPAGTPVSSAVDPTNHMLINDLDLRVIGNGTTNFPWKLDPASPTSAATTGDNLVDNVEQVFIPSPAAGVYTVRVTHKGNLVNDTGATADQRLSLLISGNTPLPAPELAVTDFAPTATNEVSFLWPSTVGRVYQIIYRDQVETGFWQNATGEISATKTNVAASVTISSGVSNRFFRVVEVR